MSSREQRPITSFYGDINDPHFADNFFDYCSDAITEYVAQLPAENLEPPELDTELQEFSSKTHEDYIIHIPNGSTYHYQVLDRGNGLHQVLARQGGIDFNNPARVRGRGKVADSVLRSCLLDYRKDYVAVSSDGLLIEGPYEPMIESKHSESASTDDTGAELLGAGLSRVFAHEIVFDTESNPTVVNGDLQHYQYGIETTEGFIPMISILHSAHPVVNAWRNQQTK